MARSDYYIPVFDSLPRHRKERDLRKAMSWNGLESVGFLSLFWLQVAADFPDGELPGLDGLTATIKEALKKADIRPKRHNIQRIALALADSGWIDPAHPGGIPVHDWEDGAGMFAAKRQQEREKKRLQREKEREAKRRAAAECVPGTDGGCPPDVPGEKKKGKRENIPPSPPQAGGEIPSFAVLEKTVRESWEAACARVPVAVVWDNRCTKAAADLAKMIQSGGVTMDDARRAMGHFLYLKHDTHSPKAADMTTWGFPTLVKSLSTYIPKGSSAPVAPVERREMVHWLVRCDGCGAELWEEFQPVGTPAPAPTPCVVVLGRFTEGERKCDGVMRVVKEEVVER